MISNKVGRHNRIFSVLEDPLQLALGSSLDGLLDVGVGSALLESDGQVDDGDVGGGDSEGHAGEFTVEGGDDFADGLGGTGRGGDDVCGSGTTATPILVGGAVDRLLGGGGGVDGGHQTFSNSVLVVDDLRCISMGRLGAESYLGERSKTVCGAAGVGDDLVFGFVGIEVDAANEHGRIGRGSRDDDFLCSTLEMGRCLVLGGEDTR
jgi:hypothetical protein